MSDDLASSFVLTGRFDPTNSISMDPLQGTFTITQGIDPNLPIVKYHYIMEGCYRDPAWSRIFQPVPWEWLFLLAPLFIMSLACLNGQGLRGWRIWIMIVIGCCSFASNKIGNMYTCPEEESSKPKTVKVEITGPEEGPVKKEEKSSTNVEQIFRTRA